MQVLIGDGSGQKRQKICQKHGIGRMLCGKWPKLYEGEPWGFDNKAYIYWTSGQKFDEADFLKRLARAVKIPFPPYLAVTPDIVAGGMKSLEFSESWRPRLPREFPWYLAVQDGMDPAAVIDVLPHYAGIFLGGSRSYKQFAGYWLTIAHHMGKKFHYARAGTLHRLADAIMIKADSLDSTFPLWTTDRLWAFVQALSQQPLEGIVPFYPHPTQGVGALVQGERQFGARDKKILPVTITPELKF